ncbi:MAG: hypothetical protein WA747_08440 [Steroidobacteraceae bacterium]
MFVTLLIVTFVVALGVSGLVVFLFSSSIGRILQRIVADDISSAWLRYMKFAMFVVGISGGVRVFELERYITPQNIGCKDTGRVLELSPDRWILELYRTVIGALESIAWMLLVFFVVALIAYVIVRLAELRRSRGEETGR